MDAAPGQVGIDLKVLWRVFCGSLVNIFHDGLLGGDACSTTKWQWAFSVGLRANPPLGTGLRILNAEGSMS